MNRTITMQITRQAVLGTPARYLHTTRPSLGFMDWFNMKKDQSEKEKKIPTKSTKEVIEDAEQDKLEIKKVDKIEFIGRTKDPKEDLTLAERLQGFYIEHWLNKEKINSLEKLDELLISQYNALGNVTPVTKLEEINLEDLKLRFDYTLNIQKSTGYIIPDYILTKSYNPQIIKNYFIDEVFSGKILKKDVEHLSHKELQYESSNIYIHTPVSDSAADKKYKKLLKKAKKDQQQRSEQLINEANA